MCQISAIQHVGPGTGVWSFPNGLGREDQSIHVVMNWYDRFRDREQD